MIQKYQSELDKILISCNICKAKLCSSCPNGKRKRYLKEELKKTSASARDFFRKNKKIF